MTGQRRLSLCELAKSADTALHRPHGNPHWQPYRDVKRGCVRDRDYWQLLLAENIAIVTSGSDPD